jgi:secondary thiamine-phosphate synthase enzyme
MSDAREKGPTSPGIVSFDVPTARREQMIDINAEVQEIVARSGIRAGTCRVFVPHTSAAVTINENADPDVQHDILLGLSSFVKDLPVFRHAEGNSTAHIQASLMGSSAEVFIEGGRLRLGTWQSLFFCEFDGPRRRKVWVKLSEG